MGINDQEPITSLKGSDKAIYMIPADEQEVGAMIKKMVRSSRRENGIAIPTIKT